MLQGAKLAVQSYVTHGFLTWEQVSTPLLYKMVYDSEVAWDTIPNASWADMAIPVKEEEDVSTIIEGEEDKLTDGEDRSAKSDDECADDECQESANVVGDYKPGHDDGVTSLKRKRIRNKTSTLALGARPVAGGDDLGASSSAGVGSSDQTAGVGSSSAQIAGAGSSSAQIAGAGSSAQIAGAGSSAWPQVSMEVMAAACGCRCRGNCGDPFCKNAQNKALYVKGKRAKFGSEVGLSSMAFCSRVPVPGFDLCRFCMCEFCKQPRSRQDTHGRWCLSKTCGCSGDTLAYVTKSGPHNFVPSWSRELKFICKFNYALHLLDPGDLAVGHDVCAQLWCRFGPPTAGKMMHAMVLFCLVWIHALKWPAAVLHFGSSLAVYVPSDDVVKDFVHMIKSSILHCHGQVWDAVFAGMFSGGASYAHGPVALGKQLGILSKKGKAGSSAVAQAGSSTASEVQVVRLGKEQMEYVVTPDMSSAYSIVQYVFGAAGKAALTWPSDDAGLVTFAESLKSFTMDIRSHRDAANFGLQGAGDPKLYTVKHFLRFVLLQVQACPMQMKIPWEVVMEWTPDAQSRCDVFNGRCADEVSNLVGLPVLKISMWACLASKVATLKLTDKQWQRLMHIPDETVMKCLRHHLWTHKDIPREETWPPGCKELVQILQRAGHV